MIYEQILILTIQCIVVALILLFLFRLRTTFGRGLLYVTIGLLKYMHFFLSKSFGFQIFPGFTVSIGSAVLFTGILFTILLIYISEDALEVRKFIYALIFANIAFAALHILFTWDMDNIGIINYYSLPKDFFTINPRIFAGGILLIFLDSVILIWLYEFFSKHIPFLFLKILITMFVVFSLHSVLFSFTAFAGTGRFKVSLVNGIVSKLFTSTIFSGIFWTYLVLFEEPSKIKASFFDIFNLFSFRKKYLQLILEKELSDTVLLKTKLEHKKLEQIIIQSPFYVIITNTDGNIEYVNPAFTKITGYEFNEIKGQNPRFLQSGDTPVELYKNLWDTILSGRIWKGELRNKKKSGELFIESATISPVYNELKEIVNFVAIKEDITERKKIEEELDKYREHLEDLVKERTEEYETVNEELLEANKDLEKFNELFVGREFRIKELRDQVKELEEKLNTK